VRSLGLDQQERVIELHVGVTKLETIKNVPGLKHHETETRIRCSSRFLISWGSRISGVYLRWVLGRTIVWNKASRAQLSIVKFKTFQQGEIMKKLYLTVVLTLTCLLGLGGSARAARDNAHSVEISDVVQIGSTKLKPGNYKVKWQGTGPAVQVSFQQNGKTVVTVPGTLKTNDDQVTQDAIVTEATTTGTSTLKEIDFAHHKEALVFDQNPGGM